MFYETKELTLQEAIRFNDLFDHHIGTEREVSKQSDNAAVILCMELNAKEVARCRIFEDLCSKELRMKALMLTYQMWLRIASLPDSKQLPCKYSYSNMYLNSCPCCDYVCRLYPLFDFYCAEDRYLEVCPMREAWPFKCEDGSSPYKKWISRNCADKTKYAKRIASKALELWKRETWQ